MNTLEMENNRVNGIGSNFTVVNPHDGYQKNNRLWFGTCSECGGDVTNSSLKGVWEHKVQTMVSHNHYSIRQFAYCPFTK